MNLLDIEVNQKNYVRILIICIIIVFIIIAFSFISLLTYKPYELEEGVVVLDIFEQNMNTHIDILEKSGQKVEIAGWAYKENDELRTINCNYVLKNQENGKMYILRTRNEENINVPEDYKISGIHSRFLLGNMPSGRYDIYVLYKNDNNKILSKTGTYLDV